MGERWHLMAQLH
jgi:hypothetical protein